MIKHNFKVGDKVKLKPYFARIFQQRTKIGEIVSVSIHEHGFIRVKYEGCSSGFPYKSNEIEPAIKVGEQLEFAFMNKVT